MFSIIKSRIIDWSFAFCCMKFNHALVFIVVSFRGRLGKSKVGSFEFIEMADWSDEFYGRRQKDALRFESRGLIQLRDLSSWKVISCCLTRLVLLSAWKFSAFLAGNFRFNTRRSIGKYEMRRKKFLFLNFYCFLCFFDSKLYRKHLKGRERNHCT